MSINTLIFLEKPMNTILLLEDEVGLRRGICFKLEKEGYHVISCESAEEGKRLFQKHNVQLVLCDITLKDGNGLEFLTYLRKNLHSNVQFIFLTAMDTEIDIVMGYETGADDYITKPFSLAVLMSKINSLFKRIETQSKQKKSADNPSIRSGRLIFYPNEMHLFIADELVELTKNECRLLQLFLSHPKQILSKAQILEQMFDLDGKFVDDNTVAVNIRRLRTKIRDNDTERIIKNIRGMGYVWDCDVK